MGGRRPMSQFALPQLAFAVFALRVLVGSAA